MEYDTNYVQTLHGEQKTYERFHVYFSSKSLLPANCFLSTAIFILWMVAKSDQKNVLFEKKCISTFRLFSINLFTCLP